MTDSPGDPIIAGLRALLAEHAEERVIVVGTTCTGKSTLLQHIPQALDMDALIFPLLTPAESAFVCQTPWTEEIGEMMTRLTRERLVLEAGHPIFGTVVLDCDRVVVLVISDELLLTRTRSRGAAFRDAKNMQEQMLDEVRASGIPYLEYPVG